METIIQGLLVQKATSPKLEPGDERYFSWEERQGKSGKPYVKIKNESKEYGGRLCSVIDAEKTDYTDNHGNVSYNVGFEPVEPKDDVSEDGKNWIQRRMETRDKGLHGGVDDDEIPMTHNEKGQPLSGVDETKRHLIQAANLYNLCADTVNAVIEPNIKGMTAELYQSALASLFIEASRSGLISKMPVTKLK